MFTMCVPRSSILSSNTSRARRLVEQINAQPINIRYLAFGIIRRASESNHLAVLDTALDDPNLFIRHIRESANQAATPPPPGNSPAGSRTQFLMSLLRSEPDEVRELAHAVLLSADDSSPNSQVDNALDNPRDFIQEMRVSSQLDVYPGEVRPNNDAPRPANQSGTGQPRSSPTETPEGLDPEVFHGLPDDVRAEVPSLMPWDREPGQRASADVIGPMPQTVRPEAQTAAPRLPSSVSPPAGKRVEEVSWPRILEWLRSRTGPRPLVLCVWCQEELVIPECDLQPEDGEREASYQLPCSHLVGQRCLHNSLELYGVRVTRCPYCRRDIGDVYR